MISMKNIVLIADIIDDYSNINLKNNNLERISPSYFNNIFGTLKTINPHTSYYSSPKDFIDNIHKHQNDIVLSVWSGTLSRNRKSIVPSICEAYQISYIGADPYINCLCQDKDLSKYIARKAGIKSSNGILISDKCDEQMLHTLKLPVVVKPNFEGGSNGISNKNVVFSYTEATRLCNELIEYFNQPILVEEYIYGTEVCVTIAGKPGCIDVLEADSIIMEGSDKYPMFGFETKKSKTIKYEHKPATNLLTPAMKTCFINLFNSLEKVDILRIDGKIENEEFQLLELSPDINLDRTASTAYAFQLAGYDYKEMLTKLLSYY